MIAIDSSVVVAILKGEPGNGEYLERIAAAEAALQQQWNSEAQQLETLRRFKAALSDSLLSGRIRVREARNV